MLKTIDTNSDAQGIDLRHERFRGEALSSAELHQALLDFADFTGAELAQADLSAGRLRFAALSGADLESADLLGADLRHARLDHADLRTARLNDAQLEYADFTGANLAGADLRGHSLRFARLSEVNLNAADLAGADLRHASLKRADLSGADLCGALLDYADLNGATLAGVDLRGADLRYARNVALPQIDSAITDERTVLPICCEEPATHGLKRRRRRFPRIGIVAMVSTCVFGACVTLGLGAPTLGALTLGSLTLSSLTLGSLTVGHAIPGTTATARAVAASVIDTVSTAPPHLFQVAVDRTAVAPAPLALDVRSAGVRQEIRWRGFPRQDVVTKGPQAPSANAEFPSTPLRLAALVDPATRQESASPASIDVDRTPQLASVVAKGLSLDLPPVDDWSSLTLNGVLVDDEADLVSDLPVLAALGGSATVLAPHQEPGTEVFATTPKSAPLTLVVSLDHQRLDVYRGTELIETTKISSGKRGHETRTGVYSILQKRRDHRSNLYDDAPMPWMQRLTRTGIALHGGAVPGYPASHGCVRLPHGFAPKLFEMTSVSENVVVAAGHASPKIIEHPLLSTLSRPPESASESVEGSIAKLKRGAPLRILVTRRTARDRAIDVQYLLASMGHLRLQNFTGRIGSETVEAIKTFQTANDLAVTGRFNDVLVAQVYDAAGKEEPPEGRLFIRQQFNRVLDVPVNFREPNRPLGTHLFSAVGQKEESGELRWTVVRLEGDRPATVLDRIAVPEEVHRTIAGFIVPGSSLIVADKSINAAILPEGDDFLVWAKHSPKAAVPRAAAKPKKAAPRRKARKPVAQRRPATTRKRTVQRRVVRPSAPPRGLFSRRR